MYCLAIIHELGISIIINVLNMNEAWPVKNHVNSDRAAVTARALLKWFLTGWWLWHICERHVMWFGLIAYRYFALRYNNKSLILKCISLMQGDQHNAERDTRRKAGLSVSTLWHRQKWCHWRARNGRNYSGNTTTDFSLNGQQNNNINYCNIFECCDVFYSRLHKDNLGLRR